MRARTINGLLAFWLFLSVFCWPHSKFQVENGWLVAIPVMFLVMVAISGGRRARLVTAALGLWLAASSLLTIASGRFTSIHNLIVGLVLAAVALVPNVGRDKPTPYEGPAEPYGPFTEIEVRPPAARLT